MRLSSGLRLVAGTVELGLAGPITTSVGTGHDQVVRAALSALGARDLGELVVLHRVRRRGWTQGLAMVDFAHAASMVVAARLWPERRTLCLASASIAAVIGLSTWRAGARTDGR